MICPIGISKILIRFTHNISNIKSGIVFNYAFIIIIYTTVFIGKFVGIV